MCACVCNIVCLYEYECVRTRGVHACLCVRVYCRPGAIRNVCFINVLTVSVEIWLPTDVMQQLGYTFN